MELRTLEHAAAPAAAHAAANAGTAFRPRVAFVIPALRAGGAERTMCVLANDWAARGWDIALISLDADVPSFYALDPRIRLVSLDVLALSSSLAKSVADNLGRVRAIRDAVRVVRPDVVISFMETLNVVTLLATRFMGVPVVVSEHMLPWLPLHSYAAARNSLRSSIWKALRRLTYPSAQMLVVLTESARAYFPPRVRERTEVIPNPVLSPGPAGPPPALRRPLVVAMGRLVDQKGFDYLIDAFAKLAARHAHWSLVILGEGPLRGSLEHAIDRHGLRDRVSMPGAVARPDDVLQHADLFVLPSRFEAFPNALLEAMSAGLPVVATACCDGVGEIVREGIDGVLVPVGDVDALAGAVSRLMDDDELRARMGARATDVRDRYGLRRITAIWEQALRRIVAARRPREGSPCA